MDLEIRPFTADWIAAVAALNARLAERGFNGSVLPERPKTTGGAERAAGLVRESFVLTEGDAVRGGYVLKRQEFLLPSGERRGVGNFQIPVSEGVVDRRYALAGLHLLADAGEREPRLYALGIGGSDEPLTRMLKSAGWRIETVPFLFRVLRPSAFLRHVVHLRSSPWRRLAFDLAAALRLAEIPLRAAHRLRDRQRSRKLDVELVESFDFWTDELWEKAAGACSFAAVRSSAVLNLLYPTAERRFLRLAVRGGGAVRGWALLLLSPLDGHRHFGSMRLGAVVDVLALPGFEDAVASAATRHLAAGGADLLVTNQSHRAWTGAFSSCGYFRGPSNFLFAASPALAAELPEDERERIHMTRGDGDGPIHLS